MSEQYISKEKLETFLESSWLRAMLFPTQDYSNTRELYTAMVALILGEADSGRLSAPQVVGGELLDYAVLTMLRELHSNVPADKQPVGMCDLSDDQAKRAKAAVHAVIAALSASPVAGWVAISENSLPERHQPVALMDINRFQNCHFELNIHDTGYLEGEAPNLYWSIRGERAQVIEAYTHYFVLPPQPATAEEGEGK